MERQRSKARIAIFALVVALLLFACAAMLRRSVSRDQTERRLNDTRAVVNDVTVAAADSPLERNVRAQLSAVLARATVESLERPVIAAAVVPEWKRELQLHWVAKSPDVDAIEVRVGGQPPMRRSLTSEDVDANRKEAAGRVLYSNTIQSSELEKLLTAGAAPGTRVTVVLIAEGQVVSDAADITLGAK